MEEKCLEFQGGSQISKIPKSSGLYAWYYKPIAFGSQEIVQTLSSFSKSIEKCDIEIQMRYGVRLIASSTLDIVYGFERKSSKEVINDVVACADDFLIDFLQSDVVHLFTRPIYIGLAKNLYQRVYNQHYLTLDSLWDPDSSVSKYLNTRPETTVEKLMDDLGLGHSFALEARVRNIAPRDLMVTIFKTKNLPLDIGNDDDYNIDNTPNKRRALEKLLQILADPICGRR